MDLEPEVTTPPLPETPEFAEPPTPKPLELLRDAETLLRRKTVAVLMPILPESVANNLEDASDVAEDSLAELAKIDIDEIGDRELQPARILIGLSFVGFGALALLLLLLYLVTIHPELSPVEQIYYYWHQYIWLVSLGVTGMLILGREAMRPKMPEITHTEDPDINSSSKSLPD